jgi:hypothetical protein
LAAIIRETTDNNSNGNNNNYDTAQDEYANNNVARQASRPWRARP